MAVRDGRILAVGESEALLKRFMYSEVGDMQKDPLLCLVWLKGMGIFLSLGGSLVWIKSDQIQKLGRGHWFRQASCFNNSPGHWIIGRVGIRKNGMINCSEPLMDTHTMTLLSSVSPQTTCNVDTCQWTCVDCQSENHFNGQYIDRKAVPLQEAESS